MADAARPLTAWTVSRVRLRLPAVRSLVRGGAVLFAGSLVWQASNFVFNAVSARRLGPAAYGSLAAVTGLAYLGGPVFTSVQTVASRLATAEESDGRLDRVRGLLRFYGLRLAGIGVVLWACVAVASPFIAHLVRVPTIAPFVVIGSTLVLSTVTHLQRGGLQGTRRFERYGLSSAFEGVAKIAIAVVMLRWVWRTPTGAVLAIPLAAGSAIALNWILLRGLPAARERIRPERHPVGYSLATLWSLVLLALLLSADVVAAHRYLPATRAGVYASVSLSGRILFFAVTPLASFLFPIFSSRHDRGTDSRVLLGACLGMFAAGAATLVAFYFVAPGLLIGLLFGSGYRGAEQYVGWMSIAFALYGAAYLASMYLLAHRRAVVGLVLGGAFAMQLVAFRRYHASIAQIMRDEIAVFGATAAVLIVIALVIRHRAGPVES